MGCRGKCIFCDQTRITGNTGFDWTAVLPGIIAFLERNDVKPKQVAFYGGSFTGLDRRLQESWLTDLLPYLDKHTSIRISTRPDLIDTETLDWCRQWRISTIELGIQDFSDAVLKAAGRQYNSEQAIKASISIQAQGFALGIKLMLGLPGWDQETLQYNKLILSEIRPRFARFYPTVVLSGTPLANLYESGQYQPLDLETAIAICADYAVLCEKSGIRAIKYGLPSTLDPAAFLAGAYHPAFGELVMIELLVREILLDHNNGKVINLSRQQALLLRAHDRHGSKILKERLASCSLNPADGRNDLTGMRYSV